MNCKPGVDGVVDVVSVEGVGVVVVGTGGVVDTVVY